MTNKKVIIDKVNVSGCEYLYTDSTYNDKCCSASIGGDSLCKPSEMLCVKYVEHLKEQLKRKEQECKELKNKIELLEEELSVIQHNCNREGCKYYDDDTFKVFYECKAQKALQLSANSVTTKYCDLLKALAEIKEIAEGMYDLWINKTKYTDIGNLVKHLLECELNRIIYKLDEISECEVENERN